MRVVTLILKRELNQMIGESIKRAKKKKVHMDEHFLTTLLLGLFSGLKFF